MLKQVIPIGSALVLIITIALVPQRGYSNPGGKEGGQVLALESAWNHAIEEKDTKALNLLLDDSMVALDSDGSFSTKSQYLAGIKSADFQPSQAVNESNDVQVYGDSAVAVGVFRIKEMKKGKPFVHRERTIDTWVKANGTWKCVAAVAVTIPANQPQ